MVVGAIVTAVIMLHGWVKGAIFGGYISWHIRIFSKLKIFAIRSMMKTRILTKKSRIFEESVRGIGTIVVLVWVISYYLLWIIIRISLIAIRILVNPVRWIWLAGLPRRRTDPS